MNDRLKRMLNEMSLILFHEPIQNFPDGTEEVWMLCLPNTNEERRRHFVTLDCLVFCRSLWSILMSSFHLLDLTGRGFPYHAMHSICFSIRAAFDFTTLAVRIDLNKPRSSVCRVNCCWPSPTQSFFVTNPAGLVTILHCLTTCSSHEVTKLYVINFFRVFQYLPFMKVTVSWDKTPWSLAPRHILRRYNLHSHHRENLPCTLLHRWMDM
jgi:hypothetical protein